MCRRRDAIDAVTNAARRLEQACLGTGTLCPELLLDPSTVKLLPMSEDSEAIERLLDDLKRIH